MSAASGTPTTPTQLFNGVQSCSTDADKPTYLGAREGLTVMGIPGSDEPTDNAPVTVQYQAWPVTDPSRITTVSRERAALGFEATVDLPADAFTDGETYAWRAQTVAGGTASDWSTECYVTIDNTAPSKSPTLSVSNYSDDDEWNQGGEPVHVTLDSNGVDDVTGFEFSWTGDFPVIAAEIGPYGVPQFVDPYSNTRYRTRADTLGGSATLNLIPPQGSGVMTLWVRSLDRAYHPSPRTSYTFRVKSTAPTVTPSPSLPQFGKRTTFTLKPNPALQATSRVVSYSVATTGGQNDKTITVKASADGTAKVTLTLDGIYHESVDVKSTSANGWVSDAGRWYTSFDTTATVSSDVYTEDESSGGVGVPSTFTFAPKVKGVVSYTYSFNWGPEVTVKAGAHQAARISWNPSQTGFQDLMVYATTRDGVQLAPYDYVFYVN
ncbi:hypothetical protein ACIHCX_13640 [Streptomyces sp. NPDC052043]|uniref:hypothetical protein n=1 Tax=Streptomyces sp. NPDC052043 TaxID=3365684 RepID=UPI0037D7A0E6